MMPDSCSLHPHHQCTYLPLLPCISHFAAASAFAAELMVHRNLGVACTALGAAQTTAIVFRPTKGTKYRPAWEVRSCALACGAVQVDCYWSDGLLATAVRSCYY